MQLNPSSTVKEIVYKSPAEEWHPREGNGENIKGLKKSTFQSVLNRPLLDDGGVDSSTDTLVPESDVEERRKLYSSALRQEQHLQRDPAQTQDKEQPQLSACHTPLRSVATRSTRFNDSTTLEQDTEGRQSVMVSLLYTDAKLDRSRSRPKIPAADQFKERNSLGQWTPLRIL